MWASIRSNKYGRVRRLTLAEGPALRLIPHPARHADHPHVVNHGRTTERADFDGVESESCGGCRRNIGNASCVAGPARRLEVGVVADGLQGLVEPVVAEFQAETRIECDHHLCFTEAIHVATAGFAKTVGVPGPPSIADLHDMSTPAPCA